MAKPGERAEIERLQTERLYGLLEIVLPDNRFYARKLGTGAHALTPGRTNLQELLARLPFTEKNEILEDQAAHPPYGSNLTFDLGRYTRLHQTSGSTGKVVSWLDTAESWDWMLGCWLQIYRIAGIGPEDRLFFAFSFGPFLGFWTAFESASRLGCLCLPGGGMSSAARLRMIFDHKATAVLCTPTYALRLAELALESGLDLASSSVRALVVAGEPGGSLAATRKRMEESWGARVFDHAGMTEIGPVAVECQENPGGMHILESEYIAEVVDPRDGSPVEPGKDGELVLTNLGRLASPLIRYRTGDIVRFDVAPCPCGLPYVRLAGGILGRLDDMIHVRGNNVYPSAIEELVRGFTEVAEYRIEVDSSAGSSNVLIQVEPSRAASSAELAERVRSTIRDRLFFRPDVQVVAAGTLPRFEMKARRISIR